jgi:general nucleoside transport system ATP-binding protein
MVLPSCAKRAVNGIATSLTLEGISRHYGAVVALDDVTFGAMAGTVHALLGENGAGKSTLMKIAFGLELPDDGRILIDGNVATIRSPRDAMRYGIGMVQQHFALVEAMTVAENVALGREGRLNLAATAAEIVRIAAESGLPIDPHARVSTLALGAQQRVEIVRALARNSRILILDEPTAVLTPQETRALLSWARRFADSGGTVILIAHKLQEVLSVADSVTVLRNGRRVLSMPASHTSDVLLADAMLGRAPDTVPREVRADASEHLTAPVITLTSVSAADEHGVTRLRDATLALRAGELLGIVAIEGSGQRELLRVMAGRLTPLSGTVTLPPSIGFMPEDRHRDAAVLDATLTENVALRRAGVRHGIMPWAAIREQTTALLSTRDVRAPNADVSFGTLSGGNQQKLVLGRELEGAPAAIIVENPTRGLDIRATAEVHQSLRNARNAGTCVAVYSSDLDEVLSLADRVIVVAAGHVHEVTGDRETIGRAMLSAAT